MRIIEFIEQPVMIGRILTYLPACAEGRQGAPAGPEPTANPRPRFRSKALRDTMMEAAGEGHSQ